MLNVGIDQQIVQVRTALSVKPTQWRHVLPHSLWHIPRGLLKQPDRVAARGATRALMLAQYEFLHFISYTADHGMQ